MTSMTLLDSTLRDGAQGENISFTVADKVKIARALDRLGVGYIEAGNPGANPKDAEFFRQMREQPLQTARLTAFGSTCRPGRAAEGDEQLAALLAAGTPAVSVFGKSSLLHVREVLHTAPEENLRMIADTVAHCKAAGREVLFDAEHFFDGFALDRDYALETLRTAANAGADWVVLCDTNGASFGDRIAEATAAAVRAVRVPVGIHCHNDCGLAVANALAAMQAGARQIQGTLLGFGERCGNTNLSTVIGVLQAKRGVRCIPADQLCQLTPTAAYVAEIANLALDNAMPFVGKSAFAHKGGMHADGVLKNPASFEHMLPQTVGNSRSILLSEQSGRSALLNRLSAVVPGLTKGSEELRRLSELLKERELDGYMYEAAVASFELLAIRELGRLETFFEVVSFRTLGEERGGDESGGTVNSSALVKVRVGNEYAITADEGNGPVNALDKALRKAVLYFYPSLGNLRLTDFKVRVISPEEATGARVRVLIESTDGRSVWTTVGVNCDIIHASLDALVDSIAYKLLMDSR